MPWEAEPILHHRPHIKHEKTEAQRCHVTGPDSQSQGELWLGLEHTFMQSEDPSSSSLSHADYPLERRRLHPSSHCLCPSLGHGPARTGLYAAGAPGAFPTSPSPRPGPNPRRSTLPVTAMQCDRQTQAPLGVCLKPITVSGLT